MREWVSKRFSVGYWASNRHLQTFVTMGALGALLNLGLLFVFTEWLRLYYLASGVLAFEISLLWTFVLHDKVTWKHVEKRKPWTKRLARFHAVSVAALFINMAVLGGLTELAHLWYMLSSGVGILVAAVWNYKVNNRVTFV